MFLFSSSLHVRTHPSLPCNPNPVGPGAARESTEDIISRSKHSVKSLKNDVSNWQSLQVAAAYATTVSSVSAKPYRRGNVCSCAGHVGERMLLHLSRTESSLLLGVQGTVHTFPNVPDDNAHSDSQLL